MATTRPGMAIPTPRRRRVDGGQLVLHLILFTLAFVSVVPFIWSIFASFKPFRELVSSPDFLPHTWTLNSYREIFGRANFLIAFRNSVIVAASVTGVSLLTSAAVGYVFAKYRFWGKEVLFTLVLGTLMVPFAVVLVPLFITINNLGLVNSLGGIIVTGLWSSLAFS